MNLIFRIFNENKQEAEEFIVISGKVMDFTNKQGSLVSVSVVTNNIPSTIQVFQYLMASELYHFDVFQQLLIEVDIFPLLLKVSGWGFEKFSCT